MTDALLTLENVTVTFGALRANDKVSLAVPASQRRAIIGPNGAGKTTLFNAIAGVHPVSGGTITYDGRRITRMRVDQRARMGIARTFQITNLFGGLTVEENVQLAARGIGRRKFSLFGTCMSRDEEEATIERAIDDSGLGSKRSDPTRTLSYGEQRQLELALALVARPRLLLLDEPAAGLSPAERVDMAATIRALPREMTLILIEHDMDLALRLVDYVTCLYDGKVLVEDVPANIRSNSEVQEIYLGKARHA
ncbi:MAG TPA: ABC transporter ATP-binding protein [Candidatus Binatia bacterium]|jgi:branched-chain amino acid transport system ATP-binding protein